MAIVKGTYQVTDDTAVVRGGFSCWVSAHTFERYIGKTIRLYGGSHGVMAFDLMTNVEARLAAEREAKERQLELKLVRSVDCRIPGEKEPSNEIFFRRGQGYFNSNAYPAAKICFLSALKEEQSSKHYKEACYYLGMMYELGKGVSKDMDIAKDWYSKAGL